MKNIYVISGVAGMTGNELARKLLLTDSIVIGFDNFFASSIKNIEDLQENRNFYFFEYDLNCNDSMTKLKTFLNKNFLNNNLSFINCAAIVHTKHFYEVNDTFETNVIGMKSFLDMAIDLKVKSYINCSTSEIYSMQSWIEGGVKESNSVLIDTAEASQRTSYATGKLLTEFFLRDAVHKGKIRGCSVRFANVYSSDELYAEHIIPYIIDSFMKSKKIILLENSKINQRSFLHNYDSCSSIISLLESEDSLDGSVYNVGTDEEIKIVDLVDLIAKKMYVEDYEIEYVGYRESDPRRRLLNTEKIRNTTNWKPKIDLNKGLDMCIEYRMKSV